ncbi:hypothetical protein WJX82_010857 [Trebouxia sp. C0006]
MWQSSILQATSHLAGGLSKTYCCEQSQHQETEVQSATDSSWKVLPRHSSTPTAAASHACQAGLARHQ